LPLPSRTQKTYQVALATAFQVKVGVAVVIVPVGVRRVAAAGVPLFIVNVAVTLRAAVMVTWHVVLVPVQAPLQPVKVAPVPAAAVRVTGVVL
jgi:hypothetical protein